MALALARLKLEQWEPRNTRNDTKGNGVETAPCSVLPAPSFAGRALIIAPQGTARCGEDEEDGERKLSQWRQAIARFAPRVPVYDRRHVEGKNAIAKARKQITLLRNICADPKGEPLDLAKSNYNPKTVTVLQLVLECLQRGEQAVVVSARTGQTDEYYFCLAAAIGETKLARIDSTVLPSEHAAEADRFKRGEARVLFIGSLVRAAPRHDRGDHVRRGGHEGRRGHHLSAGPARAPHVQTRGHGRNPGDFLQQAAKLEIRGRVRDPMARHVRGLARHPAGSGLDAAQSDAGSRRGGRRVSSLTCCPFARWRLQQPQFQLPRAIT